MQGKQWTMRGCKAGPPLPRQVCIRTSHLSLASKRDPSNINVSMCSRRTQDPGHWCALPRMGFVSIGRVGQDANKVVFALMSCFGGGEASLGLGLEGVVYLETFVKRASLHARVSASTSGKARRVVITTQPRNYSRPFPQSSCSRHQHSSNIQAR